MGWKCAPQVMGLVRGEPKPGQKHRANIHKIAKEAGYERGTKSETFDRSRSHLNRYEGYTKGAEFADDMVREADEYKASVTVKNKDGTTSVKERSLRSDAVIGWSVIYNPPAEICATWSDDDYAKFYSDCDECMEIIEPRVFRRSNIRFSAEHFDEGVPPEDRSDVSQIDRHIHKMGICMDKEGHYCGNLIDAKLRVTINKQFPALMRQRGWDMDDLDVTDFDRAKVDSEYKAERDYKRGQSGKSVNQHIRQKADMLMDEAEAMYEAGAEMLADGSERIAEADAREADKERVIAEKEKAESELQALNKKLTKGQRILSEQAGKYRQKQSESEQLDSWITAKRSELKEVQDDKTAVERAADEAEKRKRAADEGSQQFYEFLTGALKRVRGDDVTEEQTLEELQYALEREFQIWEDSLDAQKQAHEEREKKLEQAEVVKSPSSAADFLLGLVKDSKQYKGDADMVRTISLLQNVFRLNRKDYDAQYERHIEQIRQKREGIKRSESPIMSHTGREGLDFER